MRFTLPDRRPNISVGKPIYPRLRAYALLHLHMQIKQVGQYVANIYLDFSSTCRLSGLHRRQRRYAPSENLTNFNIILYLHDIYYNARLYVKMCDIATKKRVPFSIEKKIILIGRDIRGTSTYDSQNLFGIILLYNNRNCRD